ncbi:hypothetical protein OJ998_16460 [Solirubrobacter taibaiensis]|nr:hypothetical protein [Solirubrobacter taibaiensis]
MPICRFAAEPPQGGLPAEDDLKAEFLAACLRVETDSDDPELGTAGDIHWFPDRTWSGRTYVPATARTSTGLELFGYVSFSPGDEPSELYAFADYTPDVADDHPEWKMDISQEVIGAWRGENGDVAAMTLVWGVPFERRGRLVTALLGEVAVDESLIEGDRFTLLAPDDFGGEYLDIVLQDGAGNELLRESLYEDDEDE